MIVKTLILLILSLWNLLVFFSYGLDKSKAKHNAWRISEKVLLLESIFFGGIGALCGGKFFHHKTRKPYFWLAWFLGLGIDGLIFYILWRF